MNCLSLFATSFFLISCTINASEGNSTNQSLMPKSGDNEITVSSDSLIQYSATLDNAYYTSTTAESYLYLDIQAGFYQNPDVTRAPLNLALVLDKSGSMKGDKIDYVRRAANFIIDNLTSEDLVSIITYDNQATTVVHSGKVTDKAALRSKVNRIGADGSTNLSGGLLNGYQEVKSTYNQEYVNRVLLLSDGLANEGITDESQLQEIAKNMKFDNDISLSTFGVGLDYNENLMMNLAEFGSGNYYFIENPSQIPTIFEEEMNGLLNVVAQGMMLHIDIPNGVKVKQTYGYERSVTQSDNALLVNLGDLSSENTKALMVVLEGFNTLPTYEIATKLAFKNVTSGGNDAVVSRNVSAKLTSDVNLVAENIDKEVKGQYALFYSNYLQEMAMRSVDKRDFDGADDYYQTNENFLQENKVYYDAVPELEAQDSLVQVYGKKIETSKDMNERQMKVYQKSNKKAAYDIKKKKVK